MDRQREIAGRTYSDRVHSCPDASIQFVGGSYNKFEKRKERVYLFVNPNGVLFLTVRGPGSYRIQDRDIKGKEDML